LENKKISSIGRPLDFNYKTNKVIAIITGLNIIIGFLLSILTQIDLTIAIIQGLSFGITFFVSWAITREIDPDNSLSAFIGLIPLFLILFFWFETNILFLFWLLISLRIINRTTGLPASIFDSAMFFVFSLTLSYFYNPIFGFLTAGVFLFDTKLIDGQRFQLFFASLSTFLSIIIIILINQTFELSAFSDLQLISIITIATLFVFIPYFTRDVKSKGDITNKQLSLSRIRAAQFFALFAALIVSFLEFGLTFMIPVWCALFGVIIYRISLFLKD
jgi:hypothetical protein